MNSKNTLAHVLQRENNNIDLIRLLAACAVIYGHSFALIPNVAEVDFLYRSVGIYSAEWGVKTFFFLSGLFVVNSVQSGEGAVAFLIKRFSRIWPALFLVVSLSAFVIGPLCTTLPMMDYFANSRVYDYVINMSLFKSWGTQNLGYYDLPGVFAENIFKNNVNAPLWTLPVFIFAYLLILALSLIGAFNKRVAIILFGVILLDTFLPTKFLFFWLPVNSNDFTAIPFCFTLGGLLAVYKEKIAITAAVPLGFFLLLLLFKGWVHGRYLAYTCFFMFSIYVASIPMVAKFKKLPGLSYGVFLWGWPIQQVVSRFTPNIGFYPYVLVCLALSLLMGYVSWILIEKRAIEFGRFVASLLPGKVANFGRQSS